MQVLNKELDIELLIRRDQEYEIRIIIGIINLKTDISN